MTFEDYHYYSDLAYKFFNYMNGRVNTTNRFCTLQISMTDLVNHNLGSFEPPNHITLYMANIIDEWLPKRKNNTVIGTSLAWTIAHELSHADQILDRNKYNIDDDYMDMIEAEVQANSYRFVLENKEQLSSIAGFPILMDILTAKNLDLSFDYHRMSLEEFYINTMCFIVMRSEDFINTKLYANYRFYDDIKLSFFCNSFDNDITIKRNGIWLQESVVDFSNDVYNIVGRYDTYLLRLMESDMDKYYLGTIDVTDQLVCPMLFEKEYRP